MSSIEQDEVYHSPSSRESPEKIYATPSEEEWYSESPPRKSLSPAAVKKFNEEIEALSSHSSDPECNDWNPIGKIPDEIAAWCAESQRCQRSAMTKHSRLGVEGKLQVFARTASCND